jgi:regulator of sigma E protease
MEFLASIFGGGWTFLTYLIPFLFVLSVVVFFHELGHFLVARWCGVRVETFSIGFGGEIFGWTDRHGTRWKVSWLPLGGYVKFWGDDSAASTPDHKKLSGDLDERQRSEIFHFKPLHQRAAVVAAGPIANFLLAIVIFAGLYSIIGQQVTVPRVDEVRTGSPAAEAGFRAGDVVLSIDGRRVRAFSEMQRVVALSADQRLTFVVERDGREVTIEAVPALVEETDRFGNTHRIGQLGISRIAGQEDYTHVRYGPLTAVWMGGEQTVFIITQTLNYIGGIIVGRHDADQLGGPLRIAQVSGQVASIDITALIYLTAIISVSIGLINLFPIPMLDGGHLLYYAYEAVAGKPLGEKAQEYGFRLGLVVVLCIMVFATWNDLVHLRVFEFLGGLFS